MMYGTLALPVTITSVLSFLPLCAALDVSDRGTFIVVVKAAGSAYFTQSGHCLQALPCEIASQPIYFILEGRQHRKWTHLTIPGT